MADSDGVQSLPHPTPALPSAQTRRWTKRQKLAVVAGVQTGTISLQEACDRYSLSEEEFTSWLKLSEPQARAARPSAKQVGVAPAPRQPPS